jgi:hypothetical protein
LGTGGNCFVSGTELALVYHPIATEKLKRALVLNVTVCPFIGLELKSNRGTESKVFALVKIKI